jgi:cadmium resistance protein CadD (predicted permease)
MVRHPSLGAPLRRYGHVIAPLVLIGFGILIIYDAGTIPFLLHRVM